MPLTNLTLSNILKYNFGSVVYNPALPPTYYIGLSSTAPTQAGSGFTEPSGSGYARVAVTNSATNFGPIATEPTSGYSIQNIATAPINFPISTGSWGATLTYGGLFDSLTGGNLWLYGVLAPAITVSQSNVQVSFNTGQLVFSIS